MVAFYSNLFFGFYPHFPHNYVICHFPTRYFSPSHDSHCWEWRHVREIKPQFSKCWSCCVTLQLRKALTSLFPLLFELIVSVGLIDDRERNASSIYISSSFLINRLRLPPSLQLQVFSRVEIWTMRWSLLDCLSLRFGSIYPWPSRNLLVVWCKIPYYQSETAIRLTVTKKDNKINNLFAIKRCDIFWESCGKKKKLLLLYNRRSTLEGCQ